LGRKKKKGRNLVIGKGWDIGADLGVRTIREGGEKGGSNRFADILPRDSENWTDQCLQSDVKNTKGKTNFRKTGLGNKKSTAGPKWIFPVLKRADQRRRKRGEQNTTFGVEIAVGRRNGMFLN